MKTQKVLCLLQAILEKTQDASLRAEIEAVIDEITSTGEQDNNDPPVDQKTKKTVYKKAVSIIGTFFTRVAIHMVSEEMLHLLETFFYGD